MRAQRFPLEMPVRYRSAGSPDWRDGMTVNISRSGILFLAGSTMTVDERIEVCFALPRPGSPTLVVCRGRVVRIAEPSGARSTAAVAATISRYRFTTSTRMAA